MATLQNVAINIVRILIGYVAACLVTGLGIFLIGAVASIGDAPVEGRTALGEMANQAGYIPVVAAFAAVFAAPVALLAVAVSEFAKIDKLWYFLLVGALASIPVLFTGDGRSIAEMIRGFGIFAPVGALAGGSFWLIRHRKWPV